MEPRKKTAAAVGVLFINATATAMASTALTGSVMDTPDYLTKAGPLADQLIVRGFEPTAVRSEAVLADGVPALVVTGSRS